MHQSHAIVINPDDNIQYGRGTPEAAPPDTQACDIDALVTVTTASIVRCKTVLLIDSILGLLTMSAGFVSGIIVLIAVLIGMAGVLHGSSACCRFYILLRGAILFIHVVGSIAVLIKLYSVPILWIVSAALVAHSSFAIHSFVRLDKELNPS